MKMSHTRLLVTNFKDCFIFYRDILDADAVIDAEAFVDALGTHP